MNNKYIEIISNPSSVKLSDIPIIQYSEFKNVIDELLHDESNHCLNYFVFPQNDKYKFFCLIGVDNKKSTIVISHEQEKKNDLSLESLTPKHHQLHIFEREIHENFGVNFEGHPWLKSVRFPFNQFNDKKTINDYPFYKMDSEELHEVNVGPIHAGIIEPGCFRFICNGENVLHLEIHLGYQHRGVEQLFIEKQKILQQTMIAESIAGDTTIGHTLCYSQLIESLGNKVISKELSIERIIALELERIAIHIGDTAALCTDIAYQFGQVTNEALRTIVINTMQLWCGNRFGKSLIRTNGSNYPLIKELVAQIKNNIEEVESRYLQVVDRIFTLPSALARFEGIGKVTKNQVSLIGAVGMAARSSGLKRDIRWSHPFQYFNEIEYSPIEVHKGDAWARAMLRKLEVERSIKLVKELLNLVGNNLNKPNFNIELAPETLVFSLVEGWRGEICHAAITDNQGKIVHYKVKDPSMHNWFALVLAVRNQEISDFPLCNKSYNLSYCGNDL